MEDSTVAIIGGADGPTAIFLTGSPVPLISIAFIAVAVIAIGVIGYIKYKK